MSYSNNGHVHNPASCTVEPCQRCDDYSSGYAHGKAGAHVELLPWGIDDHAASCGCQPCKTGWGIVARALADMVRLSAPHEQGCGCSPCRRFGGILIRLRRERPPSPRSGWRGVLSSTFLYI